MQKLNWTMVLCFIVEMESQSTYHLQHIITLAADEGSATAQFNFGVLLETEDGVLMNRSLGAGYFKFAADQGNIRARRRSEISQIETYFASKQFVDVPLKSAQRALG
jgi:TPR repeat protein